MAFISVYNILALCCLANTQGGNLAAEREKRVKYALNVMG